MKQQQKNLAKASVVLAIATLVFGQAQAGGLFGDGGIFRGDVGEWLDPVENEVLTPMVQETVEATGTVFGGVIGGAVGQPEIGALLGNCWGRNVNSGFAGRGAEHCVGRGFEAVGSNRPPEMGNFCYTTAGVFGPGPMNPVGSPCWSQTPYGRVTGQVGR